MPAEVHVHHEVHHPKKPTKPQHPHHHEAAAVPAQHHVLPHQLKGFLEGGIAAIVAGVSTHPLDLIKVRMQLLGEGTAAPAPVCAPALHAPLALNLAGRPGAPSSASANVFPYVSSRPLSVPFAASGSGSAAGGALLGSGPAGFAGIAAKPGPFAVAAQIVRAQGVSGLFSGVSATALRQILYSSTRMGIYEVVKEALEAQQRRRLEAQGHAVEPGPVAIPVQQKIGAALIAGAVGAIMGNPADLALVRMQADGRLPVEARRNYRGVGDALARIVREEGVLALWKGGAPTVYRAMAVTAGQLAAYDQAKEAIHASHIIPDGLPSHVTSAFIAAVVASLASNPFDVIKTRMMNMKVDPATGEVPYKGALDCAVKTVSAEGPLALYKGLLPTIARQGPFALILFISLEQVRKLFANL